MRKIIYGAVIAVVLVVTGCAVDAPAPTLDPPPSPAVSVSPEPEPMPSGTAEMPDEVEVTKFMIELTWQNASQEDRDAICGYYQEMPDQAVSRILEQSAAGHQLTAKIIEDFLDANC